MTWDAAPVSSCRRAGLPCMAQAGGVRVQIGPHHHPVQQQTLGHGLPYSCDRLHSISASRLQHHFLLEAILLHSCLSHPPPTLKPSWHHQDFQTPGHCCLRLQEGLGMVLEERVHPEEPPLPPTVPQVLQIQSKAPRPLQVGLQLCPPAGVVRAEALGSCCSWRRQAWHGRTEDSLWPGRPRCRPQRQS